MEHNTTILDALVNQTDTVETTKDPTLKTMVEVNKAIINALCTPDPDPDAEPQATFTREELDNNRLGKIVFTYMVRNRLLGDAKASTVRMAVRHVLNTLQ